MRHNRSKEEERYGELKNAPRVLREGDKVVVTASKEELTALNIVGNFSRSRGIIANKGKHVSCVNFPGRQECVIIPNSHLQYTPDER